MAKEDFNPNITLDKILVLLKPYEGISHDNLKYEISKQLNLDLTSAEYLSIVNKLLDDKNIEIRNFDNEDRYFISWSGRRLLERKGYTRKELRERWNHYAKIANVILATIAVIVGILLGVMNIKKALSDKNPKTERQCPIE